MNTENTESQRMNKIMSEIQALQEVVTRFRQMRLDATEFACLKCIVTFKAGEYLANYCPNVWHSVKTLTGNNHIYQSKPQLSLLHKTRANLERHENIWHVITAVSCQQISNSYNDASCLTVPTHGSTELRSFRNASAIAALQDEAQLTLNSYIHTR